MTRIFCLSKIKDLAKRKFTKSMSNENIYMKCGLKFLRKKIFIAIVDAENIKIIEEDPVI